jgi:hypothetical protein
MREQGILTAAVRVCVFICRGLWVMGYGGFHLSYRPGMSPRGCDDPVGAVSSPEGSCRVMVFPRFVVAFQTSYGGPRNAAANVCASEHVMQNECFFQFLATHGMFLGFWILTCNTQTCKPSRMVYAFYARRYVLCVSAPHLSESSQWLCTYEWQLAFSQSSFIHSQLNSVGAPRVKFPGRQG